MAEVETVMLANHAEALNGLLYMFAGALEGLRAQREGA